MLVVEVNGKGGRYMHVSDLTSVAMFCPNCGHKVVGYKNDEGALSITCSKCKAFIYSKFKSKREIAIRVRSNN